ncbi:hypothetical protein Tco_0937317 [Tanacetum coccineum]|uniref:Uncharacterized protein n=1 Tax=Tanacetum coccineum TaxID=301880 RepID=A0ABQ5DER1_9ASTR
MAPKRTSTSVAPPMTQAAIRKLVADSVSAALEAQAATVVNIDNTNRNIGQGRSLSRYSNLVVDRTNHQSWEADNGSLPSAYSIPGNQCTSGMIHLSS